MECTSLTQTQSARWPHTLALHDMVGGNGSSPAAVCCVTSRAYVKGSRTQKRVAIRFTVSLSLPSTQPHNESHYTHTYMLRWPHPFRKGTDMCACVVVQVVGLCTGRGEISGTLCDPCVSCFLSRTQEHQIPRGSGRRAVVTNPCHAEGVHADIAPMGVY